MREKGFQKVPLQEASAGVCPYPGGAFCIINNDAGHQAGGLGGQAVGGRLRGLIMQYNTKEGLS